MLLKNNFIIKYGISANALKLLALIIMIIDHIGAAIYPQYRIFRYIGRLSFPIYCFLITEGMLHTRNIYVYAGRLLAFALISEIPYDILFHNTFLEFHSQNVFFTLLIGLIVIYIANNCFNKSIELFALIMGMGLAILLKTDYAAYGVLMIYCFYIFRNNPIGMTISVALTNYVAGIGGTGSQKYAALALIFIFLYSGRKHYIEGKEGILSNILKYGFYVAYPVHLLILKIILQE